MRLIDADEIIFHEIDEIGGEYWPYLGCSKDQIYSLPPVEAIPKDQFEARLKADMVAMLTEIQLEIEGLQGKYSPYYDEASQHTSEIIQQKIDKLKGEEDGNDD